MIRERLENGGISEAAVYQMLEDIDRIIVHEWELEIRFDPLKMAGLQTGIGKGSENLLSAIAKEFTIFIPYPFSPETERGRYLDRLRIAAYLKEHPSVTCKKMAEAMNRSPTATRKRMEELIKEGYIRFNGRGGHGSWEVCKELPDIRNLHNNSG